MAQRGRGGERCRPPRRRLRVARRVLRGAVPAPRRRWRRRHRDDEAVLLGDDERVRRERRRGPERLPQPGGARRGRVRLRAHVRGDGGVRQVAGHQTPRGRADDADSQRWAARQAPARLEAVPHGRRAGVLLQLHHRRERLGPPVRRDIPRQGGGGEASRGGGAVAVLSVRSHHGRPDPVVSVSRQTRRPRRGRRGRRGSRERVD